ncbi:DUF5789 family protein [Halomarina halobia]|uniref:DUF5789 family protein n=1 Tax=Halomarina halobia TaxID=3033386 RepID=A0ABD6AB11_9EURY|nr:DUF5789 family protein [Halomarina sp. PSR21]
MADEEEESGPLVELGEGESVEGAPLARVTSRLHYGIERSEVVRRVGNVEIRTPDGPRTIEDALAESDETYFPKKEALEATLRDVVGRGPVSTSDRAPDRDRDGGPDRDGGQ